MPGTSLPPFGGYNINDVPPFPRTRKIPSKQSMVEKAALASQIAPKKWMKQTSLSTEFSAWNPGGVFDKNSSGMWFNKINRVNWFMEATNPVHTKSSWLLTQAIPIRTSHRSYDQSRDQIKSYFGSTPVFTQDSSHHQDDMKPFFSRESLSNLHFSRVLVPAGYFQYLWFLTSLSQAAITFVSSSFWCSCCAMGKLRSSYPEAWDAPRECRVETHGTPRWVSPHPMAGGEFSLVEFFSQVKEIGNDRYLLRMWGFIFFWHSSQKMKKKNIKWKISRWFMDYQNHFWRPLRLTNNNIQGWVPSITPAPPCWSLVDKVGKNVELANRPWVILFG